MEKWLLKFQKIRVRLRILGEDFEAPKEHDTIDVLLSKTEAISDPSQYARQRKIAFVTSNKVYLSDEHIHPHGTRRVLNRINDSTSCIHSYEAIESKY
jgi:hypothetical protein